MDSELTLNTSEKNPDPIFSQVKSSSLLRPATACLSAWKLEPVIRHFDSVAEDVVEDAASLSLGCELLVGPSQLGIFPIEVFPVAVAVVVVVVVVVVFFSVVDPPPNIICQLAARALTNPKLRVH